MVLGVVWVCRLWWGDVGICAMADAVKIKYMRPCRHTPRTYSRIDKPAKGALKTVKTLKKQRDFEDATSSRIVCAKRA